MSEIIEMPKLSDTMTVGTLVKWLKNEGDPIASGDMVCEVETDKATMEVEVFTDGTLLKHYVSEGGEVAVGAAMCFIGEAGEDIPDAGSSTPAAAPASEPAAEEKAATNEAASEAPASPSPAPAPASEPSDTRIKASPLAKKIAADKGVDLSTLAGTGTGGRIVKADVENAPTAASPAASAPSTTTSIPVAVLEDKSIPVTKMRGVIAKRLLESKQTIPHFYLTTEVDAAPLVELRARLNKNLADIPAEKGGIKFTVNDFILKASAEALRRVPEVNASWQGDTIEQYGSVHLAFGVAIDDGLVTPVIRDAQVKTLRQVSAEAKSLIGKARNKKLTPNEMSGSTFTVTNLGMFSVQNFFGIVNPPNGAILSVGATVKKPVVNEKDEIVVGHRMQIGFSGDHRVVDGANGALFLQELKAILETPALMLV